MERITKRLAVWAGVIGLALLVPLVLTLRGSGVDGDGWHWTLSDFVIAGILLFGAASAYELFTRKIHSTARRIGIGILVAATLILIWGELAVGIFGTPFAGS